MKLFILAIVCALAASSMISSAVVSTCTGTDELGGSCSSKLEVSLTITYGIRQGFDILGVEQVEREGNVNSLVQGISLKITKTPPTLTYPLTYYHTVAYNPYEEVIRVQNTLLGIKKCNDDERSAYPTCGWTLMNGKRVEDSEGFCCNKGVELLNTGTSGPWRGEEILGDTSTLFNSFSTAHCLRLGELYYHGYEVAEHISDFKIEFEIDNSGDVYTFDISPSSRIYRTIDDSSYTGPHLRAELEGTFDSYNSPPILTNKIVYIPTTPDHHPFVQDYAHNLLMVEREETSEDGDECNKIGVSFKRFKLQSGTCPTSQAGECLNNQLYHKHQKDLQKLMKDGNAQTDYLVHGMRDFKGGMTFEAGMDKVLRYRVQEIQKSVVTLKIDAEKIVVVEIEQSGAIVSGRVPKFDGMSNEGNMEVVIANTGTGDGDFIVTVTKCNMQILQSIPSQAKTIKKGKTATYYFKIFTTQNIEMTNQCLVTLKAGATGKPMETLNVKFDTESHDNDFSWEKTLDNKESETANNRNFEIGTCECDFFNISCKILKVCIMDLIILAGVIVGLIAIVVGFGVFILAGGGQFLPQMLCFSCKSLGCCLKCVGCFTKLMMATTGGKGKRKRKRKRRKHKKRKQKKRTHSKKKKTTKSKYETLNSDEIESYCQQSAVCYMNISKETSLGKEMLKVMKNSLPLSIGSNFSLVGTIRKKKGQYQFIIHEDLLKQTWTFRYEEWVQCNVNESQNIPDEYRGYSLTKDHVKQTVSKRPWPGSKVINQPLEL